MKLLIRSRTLTVAALKLGMDKQFCPTLYNRCHYLSLLRVQLKQIPFDRDGQIYNKYLLVQVIIWCWSGDTSLSTEPMIIKFTYASLDPNVFTKKIAWVDNVNSTYATDVSINVNKPDI